MYGLLLEAKNYYEKNHFGSSSLPLPFTQSTLTTNMDEFVKQMMSMLTSHFIPIIVEQVQVVIIDTSGKTSLVKPVVPPTTNMEEVDPSISSDDCIP